MSMPIPATTGENSDFWTGGRDGRLLFTTCADCGFRTHPATTHCPSCYGANVAMQPVSGRGTVYSFTINRQQWQPGLEVPYVVAIVQLDEQESLRLLTNIVECPVEEVAIGMPVEVVFVERGPAFIPVFRKA